MARSRPAAEARSKNPLPTEDLPGQLGLGSPSARAAELKWQRQGAPEGGWRSAAVLAGAVVAGTVVCLMTGCHWAASGKNAVGARLYEQGHYTSAMQAFQEAINSDPTNPDGYYNLAASYHQQGKQRQDAESLKRAEALYNQCLDHAPNHVECHRGLAVLLMDTGRPDRAFALMKNWASQNPNDAEPRIELARLYEEHEEPQTALKYLEDAVGREPGNPRAWVALGRLRETSGDPAQALVNYQQAYALNNMQPMVAERIAALSRQLNASRDATLSQGGTQIATPLPYPNRRY